MNFFEAQDRARRNTSVLWVYFGLALLGVVVAIDALLYLFVWRDLSGAELWVNLGTGALATGGLITLASLFKTAQLGKGGEVVATDLGGRRVNSDTTDYQERKLLNVVEEMAVASGMPVPQVFIMDQEPGINAFAAGTEPSNAVIGVTRGCVESLNRDELQGVIAHEFSHILNGDMRMNIKLMGLIFGLVVVSIIGRGVFHVMRFQSVGSQRSGGRDGMSIGAALLIFGLGLMAIGAIGVFFARLIQAAVSRQREYLADASAVQFTRHPDGLAGALQKIGGQGSRLMTPKAAEASHMFFSGEGLFAFGLATHPPLEKRIRAILKNWDGQFVRPNPVEVAREDRLEGQRRSSRGERRGGGMVGFPWGGGEAAVSGLAGAEPGQEEVAFSRAQAGRALGEEDNLDVFRGALLRGALDEDVLAATRDRERAKALMYGLLLAQDQDLREEEALYLRRHLGAEMAELALAWHDQTRELHSAQKIAAMDLALPALRRMSAQECERFLEITRWLIASDAEVDLFEYMLQRLLARHLVSYYEPAARQTIRHHHLEELGEEANVLLTTFAGVGLRGEGRGELEAAYEAATAPFREAGWWDFSPARATGLGEIEKVLARFELASPKVKGELLQAGVRAVARDGKLVDREAELLRATADTLGCPLPPFEEELEFIS